MDIPGKHGVRNRRNIKKKLFSPQESSDVQFSIVQLSLSEEGSAIFNQQYPNEDWKIGIGLQFMRNNVQYSPLKAGDNLTFDYSMTFKVNASELFFDIIMKEMVGFELVGQCGGIFGTGETSVKDMLDSPHKKLYNHVNFYGKTEENTKEILYGTLTFAYRFNCPAAVERAYKAKVSYIDSWKPEEGSKFFKICSKDSKTNQTQPAKHKVDKEIASCHVAVQESCSKSLQNNPLVAAAVDTAWQTQSDTSVELHKTVSWLEEEANWHRTLQEYAILTGQDSKLVEWRQWRDIHSTKVKMRNYQANSTEYQPVVAIELHALKLFQISPPMADDNIKQLFIEYTFLTHEEEELETPFSMAKPKPGQQLTFCFRKEFPIELDKNKDDCVLLGELIRTGDVVTFNVVSEPLVEELQQYQTCELIGYAELKVQDLVLDDANSVTTTLLIKDVKEPHDEIGVLKIMISGIQAMRKVALDVLTPDDFSFV